MGRTTEKVKAQKLVDIFNASQGTLSENEIRTAEVEALVVTGASYRCLPPDVIQRLELFNSHSRNVQTANGVVRRRVFKGADVTILGRNEMNRCR